MPPQEHQETQPPRLTTVCQQAEDGRDRFRNICSKFMILLIMDWKEIAREQQQHFNMYFGGRDFDVYKYCERTFLLRNIGHAIYGTPEEEPSEFNNNSTGYCQKKLKHIRQVYTSIEQNCKIPVEGNDVWVATIFVCFRMDNHFVPVPVFRIPNYIRTKEKETLENSFVDSNGRVYKDWNNYLETNELPKGVCCYPKDGIYTLHRGIVQLDFDFTPACSIRKKVTSVLDTTSSCVMIGSMAIGVSTTFIALAPAVAMAGIAGAVASGAYGIGRSIASLVDRSEHKQSISVANAEARNCWLSIAGSSIGIAAGNAPLAISKLVQNGYLLSRSGAVLTIALNAGSLTVNGLGMMNALVQIHNKAKNGELTSLEIFQFTSSLLFFTMAAVNIKTASVVMKEDQISWHQKLSQNFQQLKTSVMNSKGEPVVLRNITQLNNKEEFFKIIGNTASSILQYAISPKMTGLILEITRTLIPGSWVNEVITVGMTLQYDDLPVLNLGESCLKYFAKKMKKEEVGILFSILTTVSKKEMDLTFALDLMHKLSVALGFNEVGQILSTANFIANYVKQIISKIEFLYMNDLAQAQKEPCFNRNTFDQEYGILKKTKNLGTAVLENCNTKEVVMRLISLFKQYCFPALKKWTAAYK